MLGSISRTGSKTARIAPARVAVSRSRPAVWAKRAVSSDSRPSDLTTMAPSKDSWATSLSWARSAWARVISGDW